MWGRVTYHVLGYQPLLWEGVAHNTIALNLSVHIILYAQVSNSIHCSKSQSGYKSHGCGHFGLKDKCSINIYLCYCVHILCSHSYMDYVIIFFLESMKLKIQVCLSNARIYLVSPNSLLFVINKFTKLNFTQMGILPFIFKFYNIY